MIKNIQKYLLLRQPTIWNIKLIPMIFIIIGLHIIFFGIGFMSTDISFKDRYYYYYSEFYNLGMLYPTSILIGIIAFIGWLILYNKNNGLKAFYPRKLYHIYMEWLMIFVITIGIALIPLSLTEGFIFKWQSAATYDEALKAKNILDKASMLIPTESDNYHYEERYDKLIPIPDGMYFNMDTLNLNLYSVTYKQNNILIHGYMGPSLLFYKSYDYYNYIAKEEMSPESWRKVNQQETVKKWLKNGERDSIYAVMKAFETLQKKNDMPVRFTADMWMKRIYNPPFFPINNNTLIRNFFGYYSEDEVGETALAEVPIEEVITDSVDTIGYATAEKDDNYSISYYDYQHELPYLELDAGYENIIKYHEFNYKDEIQWHILVCIYVAIAASAFTFSFRITNGRSWITSAIATGILIFLTGLLMVALSEAVDWSDKEIVVITFFSLWLLLFFTMLVRIIIKIETKSNKGRSNIYINLLIWMVPCLIPMTYLIYMLIREISSTTYYNNDQEVLTMLWGNILFYIVAMGGISVLVRKWKSIPEE